MEIRRVLDENPSIATISTISVIVIALIAIFFEIKGKSKPSAPTQAYYTVDDGASYFADDVNLVPPYMHDGKEAVRAQVLKGATGKPFVVYLVRISTRAHSKLEKLVAEKGGSPEALTDDRRDIEVKPPLALNAKWVPIDSSGSVTDVHPPAGVTGPLETLIP